jgi:hypothetical protein
MVYWTEHFGTGLGLLKGIVPRDGALTEAILV